MRLWITLAFLLTILVCTSVRAHHEGKEHRPETAHHNDTVSTISSTLDSIAHKLNCSAIEIYHSGRKIEVETLYDTRPTSTSSPVNITQNAKEPGEDEYDENPENEATEKPIKNEKVKSKRSTGDVNPSKNVTVLDNYSIVKTYTAAEPEPTEKPEPTDMAVTEVPICTAPFYDDGRQYNWYQILVENGGAPGKVNATRLTPNVTQVLNPCERPIMETVPPLGDLLYSNYELVEFEKMYRREEAFLRFAGTDSEFIDVHGHFAWSPPGFYRRFYVFEYRYDDTGFYVKVHKGQKCIFSQNPVMINCTKLSEECVCENGMETCGPPPWRAFQPGVAYALIGG